MSPMSANENLSYLKELRPFVKASLLIFAAGALLGLMAVSHLPQLSDHFEQSLAHFVRSFRGLPQFQLALFIFVNNASKTFLAILFGALFGVVPGIFLLANGIALGLVFTLAAQAKGFWPTLLGLAPHGIIELPAVLLGTSIGFLIGAHAIKRLRRRPDAALAMETKRGLRFFCAVIAPLLLVAAFVEVYITGALISAF